MAKSKTISLYLAKETVQKFNDVFSENAQKNIEAGAEVFQSEKLGESATAFIFRNPPSKPKWLPALGEIIDGLPDFTNRTSCAVIVFKHVERVWVIPFAHGWTFINDEKIVMDFGLKVAINSLSDEKVRRIDSNHLGEAMKGALQSAFQRNLQSFGIDEALDLVRRVSGRIEGDNFAKSLSGATSLKITKEMELSEMADIAEEALKRYNSDAYKDSGFVIIDKVRPVSDRALQNKLDQKAVESIRDGGEDFELSLPGWSEDDVVYYGLYGPGIRERLPDLLLENYRKALGEKLKSLNVEQIAKKHGVLAEFANDAQSKQRSSIRKSLVGSITLDGELYAISEGEWYRLDEQFKKAIDDAFKKLIEDWPTPPLKIIKKISEDGKKTGYETELAYNQRCAEEYGQICLDQEIFSIVGEQHNKLELCDLLDIDGKRLIHVKKSSRQSSVLSHFFKQGSNSARVLATIPEMRDQLIAKVKDLSGNEAATAVAEALEKGFSGWTVEFHIIDAPRKDGKFRIPFFSRITLREEAKNLGAMQFKVALRFIPN